MKPIAQELYKTTVEVVRANAAVSVENIKASLLVEGLTQEQRDTLTQVANLLLDAQHILIDARDL